MGLLEDVMTLHRLPLTPTDEVRLRLRNTLDATHTAHTLVWHAVDECPDVLALAALRRAQDALEDACLVLMTLHPEER